MTTFKQKLRHLFEWARFYSWTVSEITQKRSEIIKEAKAIKGFPGYCISILFEYSHFLFNELQKDLVYLHQASDGSLHNSYSNLSEEDQVKLNEGKLKSFHYYLSSRPVFVKIENRWNAQTEEFETFYTKTYRVKSPILTSNEQ